MYDDFIKHLKTFVEDHLHLLCPQDPSCTQGPLVDKIQFERVMSYIEKGVAEGATLVTGGAKKGGK